METGDQKWKPETKPGNVDRRPNRKCRPETKSGNRRPKVETRDQKWKTRKTRKSGQKWSESGQNGQNGRETTFNRLLSPGCGQESPKEQARKGSLIAPGKAKMGPKGSYLRLISAFRTEWARDETLTPLRLRERQ